MKTGKQLQPTQSTGSVTLELWVRSFAPIGYRTQQEELIRRLSQLEADGVIESYTVELWGNQLSESDSEMTAVGRHIRNRIEEFRTWATEHEMAHDSFFPTESIHFELTGEEYTQIRFPMMALAEYEGDNLRFVSPCTDGETVYTVTDRLEAIETAAAEFVVP